MKLDVDKTPNKSEQDNPYKIIDTRITRESIKYALVFHLLMTVNINTRYQWTLLVGLWSYLMHRTDGYVYDSSARAQQVI